MTAPYTAAALEPEAVAPLILALPKGRILSECGALLARAGVNPAPDYADEDSRRLRFPTDDSRLDVVRVRPFDVATFVAFGAAQLGICGADVLMEFDYPEIYAPLDLGIGALPDVGGRAARDRRQRRSARAGRGCGWRPSTPTSPAGTTPRAASTPTWCTSAVRWNWRPASGCRG